MASLILFIVALAGFVGVGVNAKELGGYLGTLPSEPELSSRIFSFIEDLLSKKQYRLSGDDYWYDYIKYYSERLIIKTVPNDNEVSVSIGDLKLQYDSEWLYYDVTAFSSVFTGSFEVQIPDERIADTGKFRSWTTRANQSARIVHNVNYASGVLYSWQDGESTVSGEHWNVLFNAQLNASQEAKDKTKSQLYRAGTESATDLLADQIANRFIDISFVENKFWTKLDSSLSSLATEVNENLEALTVTVPTVEIPDYYWTATDTKVELSLDSDAESSIEFTSPARGVFKTKGLQISIHGKYQSTGIGSSQPAKPWKLSVSVTASQGFDVIGEIGLRSSLKVGPVQWFTSSFSYSDFPDQLPLSFARRMVSPVTRAIREACGKAVAEAVLTVLKQ